MTVLEKILAVAESKGIGQLDLERRASLPTNRLSKYLSGQGELTLEYAARMAAVLGVSLDTLALGVIQPPPGPPLTDDELFILRYVRATNLSGEEAVALMSGRKPGRKRAPSAGRVLGTVRRGPRPKRSAEQPEDHGEAPERKRRPLGGP
jgi:transcriptional regulator with XRE-family HTH domain